MATKKTATKTLAADTETTNYPQYLLSSAFAFDGDKTIPPALAQTAGTGRFSQERGWQEVNQLPINEGGIPPYRTDFNGAFFMLSQLLLWVQQGGIFKYDTSLDYEIGNEVMSGGVKYRCVKENGVSSEIVAPGSNRDYWKNIDVNVPAGAVVPFANVTLGGDDNRNPVFMGSAQADTGWVLCDGGDDGLGGKTPNLIDKFIRGSSVENAGTTGGSDSTSASSLGLTGTIGGTALTTAQLPAHSHGGTCASAGDHTHTRGSMNITASVGMDLDDGSSDPSGAFYTDWVTHSGRQSNPGGSSDETLYFDASRNWTGSTSSSGSHTHTVSDNSVGSGSTHTHTLTLNTPTGSIDTVPAYYSLAYFMKLPE